MSLTIGLDIDGVVADSFPVFLEAINEHFGKDITKIDNYDMTEVFDVSDKDLDRFFDRHVEYLYSSPKPMDGAQEAITTWLQAGHEIVFVTARKCGREENVTLKWFEQHGIPVDKAVFTGGLSKAYAVQDYGINVFVDDFMTNALEIATIGVPVLLMDAPYNQGKLPKGVTRCYNWDEIKCHIDQFNR